MIANYTKTYCIHVRQGNMLPPQNTFSSNDGKNTAGQLVELKIIPKLEDTDTSMCSCVHPLSHVALNRGEGQDFLSETTFLRTGDEFPPPPPPSPFSTNLVLMQEKLSSIESQMTQSSRNWRVADRKHKYFMLCSLLLMIVFFVAGFLCLGISLKLKPLAALFEKMEDFLDEAGARKDMTTVIPILVPDNLLTGSKGNVSRRVLDFAPKRGASWL